MAILTASKAASRCTFSSRLAAAAFWAISEMKWSHMAKNVKYKIKQTSVSLRQVTLSWQDSHVRISLWCTYHHSTELMVYASVKYLININHINNKILYSDWLSTDLNCCQIGAHTSQVSNYNCHKYFHWLVGSVSGTNRICSKGWRSILSLEFC